MRKLNIAFSLEREFHSCFLFSVHCFSLALLQESPLADISNMDDMMHVFSLFVAVLILSTNSMVQGTDSFWKQTTDIRQDDEQKCGSTSFAEPTYGAGLFSYSFNKMLPGTPMGDKVFDIAMEVSADCSMLVPVGYNVQRTHRFSSSVKTSKSDAMSSMSQATRDVVNLSGGVSFQGFGINAGFSDDTRYSKKFQSAGSHSLFVSYMENVDASISMSAAEHPTLAKSFAKLLEKGQEGNEARKIFKAAYKLVGHYHDYLHSAEVGSRDTEVRKVEKTVLDRLERRDNKFSAEVSVNALFVNFGAHYGTTDTLSQNEKDLQEASSTRRMRTGANPNLETMTFPKAERPGVLKANFRPICELVPSNSTYETLKKKCWELYHSNASCFASLPEIHQLSFDNMPSLEAALAGARITTRCQNTPPAAIQLQIDYRASGLYFHDRARTVNECAMKMTQEGGIAFSYIDDKCFICSDNVHKVAQKTTNMDYDKHCEQPYWGERNDIWGGTRRLDIHDNGSKCSLLNNVPLIFRDSGCFSLVPCRGVHCFTVHTRYPNMNTLTGQSYEDTTIKPIWHPFKSVMVGEYLKKEVINVDKKCDSDLLEVRSAWQRMAHRATRGPFVRDDLDDLKIIEDDIDMRFNAAVGECKDRCALQDGCDAVLFTYYPYLRGTLIEKKTGYSPNLRILDNVCNNYFWDGLTWEPFADKATDRNKITVECQYLAKSSVMFLEHNYYGSMFASNVKVGWIPLQAYFLV